MTVLTFAIQFLLTCESQLRDSQLRDSYQLKWETLRTAQSRLCSTLTGDIGRKKTHPKACAEGSVFDFRTLKKSAILTRKTPDVLMI